MAKQRAVEWLGTYNPSLAVAVGTQTAAGIVSAPVLDDAEIETILKVLGCVTVQVTRIFSADPQTTQTVAYVMGIGVFHQDLTAAEIDAKDMSQPWMWTCSGRGVVGEEITATAGINTHQYAGLVRWYEVATTAMRKVPQDHALRFVVAADQVVGVSTGIEVTYNFRALRKR